jgi:hypothetical protein
MSQHEYHFTTRWRVKGPIQVVYDILKDGPKYADWWRPAYRSSIKVGPEKVASTVRAKLPYTLKFDTELIREQPPKELALRSTGELVGTGLWKLRQVDSYTEVDFIWDVSAEKPIIRRLSFLLKPLFNWNHDWVMKVGERGLQEEVNRRNSQNGF